MASKTFIFIMPLRATVAQQTPHAIVITTTDGLFPSGGSLSGTTRYLSNSQTGTQANNIDWTQSYIKIYDQYNSNDGYGGFYKYDTPFLKTVLIKSFQFETNGLIDDGNGETWSMTNPCTAGLLVQARNSTHFTFSKSDNLYYYSKPQSDSWMNWGGNGQGSGVGITYTGGLFGGNWKFRTQANLDSFVLGKGVVYSTVASNASADLHTMLDKRIIFNKSSPGWTFSNHYHQEYTPTSNTTFTHMGIFVGGHNSTSPSGTINAEIHACSRATLASNLTRTPEFSGTLTINDLTVESSLAGNTDIGGFAAYINFGNSVTLNANTVYTIKLVPTSNPSNVRLVNQGGVTGSTVWIGTNAGNTSFQTYSNYRLPLTFSTQTVANYAPTDISLSSYNIAENAGTNAVVGNLSATDNENNVTSFSLPAGSANNSLFNVFQNGSDWQLRANSSFDYENMPAGAVGKTLSVYVTATDAGGLTFSKTLTINVTNVNEAPTAVSLSGSLSITEGNAINAVIGTLSATDPDAGDTVTFSLPAGVGNNSDFNISGTQLRASVVFNNDTATSKSVTVRATDAGGAYKDQAFTITIANAIPSTPTLSSNTIPENSAAGTVIGTFSSTDPGGGTVTFRFASGGTDNGSFDIVGNQLKLKSGVSLNFETKSSYSIKVEAVDAANAASASNTFTISVSDVNEDPTDISLSVASIQENNAINAVIGTLSTTDPDSGNTFTYSIPAGLGDDKFNISGNQLRAAVVFDYETATSHSVTVRATDQGGLFFSKSFTISVSNDTSDDPILLDSSNAVQLEDGTIYAVISVDPTVRVVKYNGVQLPVGSLLRHSSTGQKFSKISGGINAFYAIPIQARTSWSWTQLAKDLWAILQGY